MEDGGELVEDGGEPILEQDIDQDEDYVPPINEIKVVLDLEACDIQYILYKYLNIALNFLLF